MSFNFCKTGKTLVRGAQNTLSQNAIRRYGTLDTLNGSPHPSKEYKQQRHIDLAKGIALWDDSLSAQPS